MALHLIKGEDKTILDNLDLSGTNLKTDTPNGSGDKDTEGNDHEDNDSHGEAPMGFKDMAGTEEKKKMDAILARNIDLKNQIKIFSMDRNEDTWRPVMNALLKVVHENGVLLVPMTLTTENEKQEMLFKIVKNAENEQFFTLFTSPEEVTKRNPENAAAMDSRRLLNEFLKMTDVDSIVIDPWSESFVLNKDQVKAILEADQNAFMDKRGIYFDEGNILNIDCECIVNSADPLFNDGGGVDHDIYSHAGDGLMDRLDQIGSLKQGTAVMTPAYALKQMYIIHTVGPVYDKNDVENISNILTMCYVNCLEICKQVGIHSIAFPAISTGASGFPVDLAASIAVHTVSVWLDKNPEYGISIIFSCLDEDMLKVYQTYIAEVNGGRK